MTTLKTTHGLDAEAELVKILREEIDKEYHYQRICDKLDLLRNLTPVRTGPWATEWWRPAGLKSGINARTEQ